MGVTVGAILEEIQKLYKLYPQPCFLYLSSEVIKVRFSYEIAFSCLLLFSLD